MREVGPRDPALRTKVKWLGKRLSAVRKQTNKKKTTSIWPTSNLLAHFKL